MVLVLTKAGDVTSLILDSSPVLSRQPTSSSSSHHGELFFATFKSTITQWLITFAVDAVKHLTADEDVVEQRRHIIASVITSMLDVLTHDSQLRHRSCISYLIALYKTFIRGWLPKTCGGRGKVENYTVSQKNIPDVFSYNSRKH